MEGDRGLWHGPRSRLSVIPSPLLAVPLIASPPSTPTRDEETALMLAFQLDRSDRSFDALYRATAPGLLSWIEQLHVQRRLGSDPLDTLQDTFVNVHRYAGTFQPERAGGFRAWARTIACNALRRARRRPQTAGVLFSELSDGVPEPVDAAAGPFRAARFAEDSARVDSGYALLLLQYAAAFETLGPRDREALRMVEVDGRTYAEVGAALGVGRSNTKMIVFRARKRLRASIGAAFAIGRDGSAPVRKCEAAPKSAAAPQPLRRTA